MSNEYKIVNGGSPTELTHKINEYISNGWEVVGSHQVVVRHSQNRFRGNQHVDTLNELEYSITMKKDNK